MDVEDPFKNTLGEFGLWQFPTVIFLMFVQLPLGWHTMSIIFLAPRVNVTCATNNVSEVCSKDCNKYIYDDSVFDSTIISEWDLICGFKYMAAFAQAAEMLGLLVGSILFGIASDKYGRRIPVIISIFLTIISGIAAAFIPWLWLFCLMRFINGLPVGGAMVTCYVLVMEIIGKRYREIIGISYQIPFWIGHLTLPLISFHFRHWRYYQFSYSILSCIVLPAIFIIPESPRWLLSTGKVEKATEVLTRAAKVNKRPVENVQADINQFRNLTNKEEDHRGSLFDLFKTKNLCLRTIIMCYLWFSCGFGFFGLAHYSGMIGGDVFANVAISAALEIPATILAIFSTKYLGRKPTMIFPSITAGIAMIIVACLPNLHSSSAFTTIAVLTSIGVASMCIAFANVYLYTAELFPTVVRNTSMGLASMVSRTASMIAPFVATLETIWLSSLIFGIIPIIGGIACFWVPETRGKPLPETFEDAENFGKK